MSEKISVVRRLRLEANGLGEFQTYSSREYRRLLLDAADEIERLTAERDEVRQSYCSLMEAYRGGDGKATAKKMGWQYLFKEDGK